MQQNQSMAGFPPCCPEPCPAARAPLAFLAACTVQPGWLQRAQGSNRQSQHLNNEFRVRETGQQPDPGRTPPAHCSTPKPAAIFPLEP